MSPEEIKALANLLKFAEGLWAELQHAGFSDKKDPEPWQFVKARAALANARQGGAK